MNLENAIKSSSFSTQKQKAGLNILYTAWWLKTLISQELKDLGLTHEQYNVLRILKGKHPEQMCVKDVACRMIEKNSNVPRIIDRLELKRLVVRSISSIDKRETVITITEDGLQKLKTATQLIDKTFGTVINMEEKDAVKLNDLLEKYREQE